MILYIYLKTFLDDYDVVLIDVNSSAEYRALFPLFSMSRSLFCNGYDYNCFMNNKRQQTYLNSIGNPLKFKYILNKFIDDPESKWHSMLIEWKKILIILLKQRFPK